MTGTSSTSTWKARYADRIKRSALTEAGIPFLEVRSSASATVVKSGIQALITPQQKGYNHV